MSAKHRSHRLRTKSDFRSLAKTQINQTFVLTTTLLLTIASFAQQSTPTPQTRDSQSATPDPVASAAPAPGAAIVSVPAGTRIALVLTQPIQTRYVHRGDDIYAQTTSPVTSGNEVVIPPGTFVQGKVDKFERRGGRGEIHLQSMSITFPDGYVTPIAGPIALESSDGYALKDPGKGRLIGAFALPAAGLGLGTLIGRALSSSQGTTINTSLPPSCGVPTPGCMNNISTFTFPPDRVKSMAIGGAIGLAAGGIASLALVLNTHHFFLDVGAPVEMVLQHPISLQQDEVADAIRDAEQHPAQEQPIVQRPQPTPPQPSDNGPTFCETPGTPGTPDIEIPGTPAIGDSPGTPAIHIPGIPATPSTTHLCP
jgi:hypothetical protein